jgi:hypothetical protein
MITHCLRNNHAEIFTNTSGLYIVIQEEVVDKSPNLWQFASGERFSGHRFKHELHDF